MDENEKREKTQQIAGLMRDAALKLYLEERARLAGQTVQRSTDLNIYAGRKYYLGKAVNALDKSGDPAKILNDVIERCKEHLIEGLNMESGALAAHRELVAQIPA